MLGHKIGIDEKPGCQAIPDIGGRFGVFEKTGITAAEVVVQKFRDGRFVPREFVELAFADDGLVRDVETKHHLLRNRCREDSVRRLRIEPKIEFGVRGDIAGNVNVPSHKDQAFDLRLDVRCNTDR